MLAIPNTVFTPESIISELRDQIARVAKLHDRDLEEGYDGVFLDDAIEAKYPKAPKEFVHQWFFPQRPLTQVAHLTLFQTVLPPSSEIPI